MQCETKNGLTARYWCPAWSCHCLYRFPSRPHTRVPEAHPSLCILAVTIGDERTAGLVVASETHQIQDSIAIAELPEKWLIIDHSRSLRKGHYRTLQDIYWLLRVYSSRGWAASSLYRRALTNLQL